MLVTRRVYYVDTCICVEFREWNDTNFLRFICCPLKGSNREPLYLTSSGPGGCQETPGGFDGF